VTNRLPVIGSTAATTNFCGTQLEGPDGTHLFFDGNSKITRGNGSFAAPAPNAFSLPAAAVSGLAHCPGSTPTCRAACYVGPLEKAQRELYARYEHNANQIRCILADEDLASEWASAVAKWCVENAAGGFRWHVSGDVFSPEYAGWISDVCAESESVPHWIYTRTFDDWCLEPLVSVSTNVGGNLSLNLSCDHDNYAAAHAASKRWADWAVWDVDEDNEPIERLVGPRLCYLTTDGSVPEDLPRGSVIFPDYALRPRQYATLAESPWWASLTPDQRAMVCPVDAHGKSEKNRCGPCRKCLT
jgi:hypothetical protein